MLNMNEFDKLFEEVRKTPEWDIEGAKLQITNEIHRLMEKENVTQSELATRLNKSQPYISKILKGETNFTIETIAIIARALNATFHVRLSEKACVSNTSWIEVLRKSPAKYNSAVYGINTVSENGVVYMDEKRSARQWIYADLPSA